MVDCGATEEKRENTKKISAWKTGGVSMCETVIGMAYVPTAMFNIS